MKSYKLVEPDYAVVTLEDGSTFGQMVVGKNKDEIEAEIRAGCERVQPSVSEDTQSALPPIGVQVVLLPPEEETRPKAEVTPALPG